MGVFEMHNAKKVCFWCGAPNAHTSAPSMPPPVFLETWYGCVTMDNAKKCLCVAWRSKHAYLCTKDAIKSAFLAWHPKRAYLCTKYTTTSVLEIQNVKKCVYGVAPLTCIPLHQTCHQKCFWIPSVGLFEMDNAKKCALLEWHPKRAYLCTKYTTTSVFGYLVWVCLQCTMPKKSAFWGWRPKHAYLCTTYKINRVRYLCNYYFVNHK